MKNIFKFLREKTLTIFTIYVITLACLTSLSISALSNLDGPTPPDGGDGPTSPDNGGGPTPLPVPIIVNSNIYMWASTQTIDATSPNVADYQAICQASLNSCAPSGCAPGLNTLISDSGGVSGVTTDAWASTADSLVANRFAAAPMSSALSRAGCQIKNTLDTVLLSFCAPPSNTSRWNESSIIAVGDGDVFGTDISGSCNDFWTGTDSNGEAGSNGGGNAVLCGMGNPQTGINSFGTCVADLQSKSPASLLAYEQWTQYSNSVKAQLLPLICMAFQTP